MLIPCESIFSLLQPFRKKTTDCSASSFKMMLFPVALYFNHRLLVEFGILGRDTPNPFKPLLWPSYELPNGRYEKGYKDWLFVFNQVILWSL